MDSRYYGVRVTTSWMLFQGADNQGDWHWLSSCSKRAVFFNAFWIPVGLSFNLKGHINASLQNCLTSTTKPAPTAPKWPLKQDWLGQWGIRACLCPQGHHKPSAQPKYQAKNAGFGFNSIFTYSTKIRTRIYVGYSTWKEGSKAIRTFFNHSQLSIHHQGFQSFCHQEMVSYSHMTYIYT